MKIPPPQFISILLFLFPIFLFAQQKKQTQSASIEQTNLLLVEGGTFNMGQGVDEDIVRRVTVSSFYAAATQVTNKEYREYTDYLDATRVMGSVGMRPDTTIWLRCVDTSIATQLTKDYFRLPAFDYYPVVGVSWVQATEFVRWRSDRRNEKLAIESGYWTADLQEKYSFSTSEFLAGDYHKKEGKELPKDFKGIYSNYRLLSEAEWELAAWALIGKREFTDEGLISNQVYKPLATEGKERHHKTAVNKYRKLALRHAKKYPLPSYYDTKKYNLPSSVFEGKINGYGIYNLNNNVAEWVQDWYQEIIKPTATNPNKPAPNVQRGAADPTDKINTISQSKEEILMRKVKELYPDLPPKVLKGVSGMANKKSPGNRSSAESMGEYDRLIGFRCGMTVMELVESINYK